MGWWKLSQAIERFPDLNASVQAVQSALLRLKYITDQDNPGMDLTTFDQYIASMDLMTLVGILTENNLVPTENASPERFAAMVKFLAGQGGYPPSA